MSKCPHCGRINVPEPAGEPAPCGRLVTMNDSPGILYPHPDQWRERMLIAQVCRVAGQSSQVTGE